MAFIISFIKAIIKKMRRNSVNKQDKMIEKFSSFKTTSLNQAMRITKKNNKLSLKNKDEHSNF